MTKRKSKEENEYDILRTDVRTLLDTKAGQEFVWYVLSICNIYGETFTGNSQTFYQEGKRSVGLEILQLLEDVDTTAYARLLLAKQKQKDE